MNGEQLQLLADAPLRGQRSLPKAKRGKAVARGYAAPPGSGPSDETCRSCGHAYTVQGGAKRFWKCDLVRASRGMATDLRLGWPACSRWSAPAGGDGVVAEVSA